MEYLILEIDKNWNNIKAEIGKNIEEQGAMSSKKWAMRREKYWNFFSRRRGGAEDAEKVVRFFLTEAQRHRGHGEEFGIRY